MYVSVESLSDGARLRALVLAIKNAFLLSKIMYKKYQSQFARKNAFLLSKLMYKKYQSQFARKNAFLLSKLTYTKYQMDLSQFARA